MSITCAVDAITLDEIATVLLPAQVMIALDGIDIEYSIWERRRVMNADPQHTTFPAMSLAKERILPVVVLGEMVALPGIYPLQLLDIRPGRSNRAIRAARDGDNEVVMIFVPEQEIGNYRSSEPQSLPSIGVIARLVDVASQPNGALEITMDVTTRAVITDRLQHDPYYLATVAPYVDTEVTSTEIAALMAAVSAQVEAMAGTLAPYSTPEQIEEALTFMRQIDHAGQLADFVTYSPVFTFVERIAILNALDPVERLRLVQRKLGA